MSPPGWTAGWMPVSARRRGERQRGRQPNELHQRRIASAADGWRAPDCKMPSGGVRRGEPRLSAATEQRLEPSPMFRRGHPRRRRRRRHQLRSVAITLHWATAALVLFHLCRRVWDYFDKETRERMRGAHTSTGIAAGGGDCRAAGLAADPRAPEIVTGGRAGPAGGEGGPLPPLFALLIRGRPGFRHSAGRPGTRCIFRAADPRSVRGVPTPRTGMCCARSTNGSAIRSCHRRRPRPAALYHHYGLTDRVLTRMARLRPTTRSVRQRQLG